MALHSAYLNAIETRLRWLRAGSDPKNLVRQGAMAYVWPIYKWVLEHAETFYMNPPFADLVDLARKSAPDDLAFDPQWMLVPSGWIYLDRPFEIPPIAAVKGEVIPEFNLRIRAIGWRAILPGEVIPDNGRLHGTEVSRVAPPGSYQVICFQDNPNFAGWFPWSHFLVAPGERLGPRVEGYEAVNKASGDGSEYVRAVGDAVVHPLHELRWAYAAFHLMAQRLAAVERHEVTGDRAARRRLEKEANPPSFLKVIMLRRLKAAPRGGPARDVNWQCQWEVERHWRQQWFPREGVHKRVFIETYLKGPPDKPFRRVTAKIFAARR